MKSIVNILKLIGPGIITASAAIGVSHLIQSTRAGGYFGFELLWVVIAANILKYPFIEYGFRYTSATGHNLLEGYKKLNFKLLVAFFIINIIAAIGGIAAISYISAGIFQSVTHINFDIKLLSLAIMVACIFIIALGHYKYLDNIMKFFMLLLLISTATALLLAFKQSYTIENIINPYYTKSAWNVEYIPFIIALMGWMPAPVEISVWYSLWLEAKNKGKTKLDFKQAKLDFDFGYFLMIITATFFLSLGALILHNSEQEISSKASTFASQLISTYTTIMGSWSGSIISISILAAILSTILAVVDAYPRSIAEAIMLIRNKNEQNNIKTSRKIRLITMSFCCLTSFIIIYFFVNNFKILVDVVTITAFLSAPLFAYMNYKLVTSELLPKKYQPKKWLKILSYLGFIYMIIFCVIFLLSIILKTFY